MKAYYNGYRRSGIARVHIVREKPIRRQVRSWRDHPQAWCGVSASDHTNSPKVEVDPTQPLETGLSWCGPCIGRAADHAGLTEAVLVLLIKAAA